MKTIHGNVIFLLMFFAEQVTARHPARIHASELLEHLNISPNNQVSNPLIVLVKSKTQDKRVKNSDFDDLYITGYEGFSDSDSLFYEDEAKEQAKSLLYNYLLRTGEPSNTEEEIEDERKTALRAVLRARCKKVVECKKKCEKKRPKKNCPKNCKAVFDKLNLCDPPKKKKNTCDDSSDECRDSSEEKYSGCESSDECGNSKKGRTLPPKWKI